MLEIGDSIRLAITGRRLIEIVYGGKRRVVEPHDCGVRRGATKLLVYQIRGGSGGRVPGWRDLDVPRITELTVLDETFRGSRGAQYSDHKPWDVVFARVT
jgi:hypothetical protein